MMHQSMDMFVLLKSHIVLRLDFCDEPFECFYNILGLMAQYLYRVYLFFLTSVYCTILFNKD